MATKPPTKSPPLPRNLDHLQNGRRCWFYGTSPSTQPCHGHVIGRGRDPKTNLMTLTIMPDPQSSATAVAGEMKGGTVKRTVNAVFPDLDTLNAHHAFMEQATPEEISAWTKSIIELSAMIGGQDE